MWHTADRQWTGFKVGGSAAADSESTWVACVSAPPTHDGHDRESVSVRLASANGAEDLGGRGNPRGSRPQRAARAGTPSPRRGPRGQRTGLRLICCFVGFVVVDVLCFLVLWL